MPSKGDCCPLPARDTFGFVLGHHSTGWHFVTLLWLTRAGRFAVALRWPHPGHLVQGRQGSVFSILLIPASLLWPFAPRDEGRLCTPRGLALPALLPHESGVFKAISSSRKSFPRPRHPCSPHTPSKPWKAPASHSG